MRIYIGGILMEADSFSPRRADEAWFRQTVLAEGAELELLRDRGLELAGYWDVLAERADAKVVPGYAAVGVTSGGVAKDAFRRMSERLFMTVRAALPLDGVLLELHGALAADGVDGADAYLAEGVRAIVGPDVPVVCSLDLHACLSRRLMAAADAVCGYRTYPHIDHRETGRRATRCLLSLIDRPRPLRKLWRRLPVIMPVEKCQTGVGGPADELIELTEALEKRPGVVAANLFLTQPWLDVPELGCQAGVTLDDTADGAACAEALDALVRRLWDKREEFQSAVPGPEEALRALADMPKPVCLSELGDIVSAGAVGDSTVLLRALLRTPLPWPTLLSVADGDSARRAAEAGVGSAVTLRVGGSETGFNARTELTGTVAHIRREPFVNAGEARQGETVDGGVMVRVVVDGWLHVVVTERTCYTFDAAFARAMGLAPERLGVICQKTHQLFRAGYAGILQSALYADTPGYTDRNLARLPFQQVRRPVWPLDKDTAFFTET